MRFDDPAYVQAWQELGEHPAIHRNIAAAALHVLAPGEAVMDMGACTGLLARRMVEAGHPAIAVEPSARAIGTGTEVYRAEPGIVLLHQAITLGDLEPVTAAIREHHVTTALARRVWPEICDTEGVDGVGIIAAELAQAGIRRFVIEARQASATAVHPLRTLQLEAAAVTRLLPKWKRRSFATLPNILVLESTT